MRQLLVPALLLTLAVSTFAIPEEKADLATQVKDLSARVDKQEARILELAKALELSRQASQALSKRLEEAEKLGFLLPAPNNDAKKALLSGLQDYAKSLQAK